MARLLMLATGLSVALLACGVVLGLSARHLLRRRPPPPDVSPRGLRAEDLGPLPYVGRACDWCGVYGGNHVVWCPRRP